jgi:hypothetical protein
MRTCSAPGCGGRTTSYGRFCNTHKARMRRHGAPDQRGVTKAELRPYVELIKRRVVRNEGHPLWGHAEAAWRAVEGRAREILTHFAKGNPGSRYERIAAIEIMKLAENVEPLAVMEAAWGMYLMQHDRPRRFVSDDAFRAQLVRRVRGLAEVNVGEWFDHREGRVKRAYRDLAPGVMRVIGRWLASALGGAGVYLAELEQRQREEKQQQAARLAQAMKELK